MKKSVLSAIIFIVVFTAIYLSLSFLVPGLRIKLEAAPFEYFIESLKSVFVFKFIISFAAAFILGAIPLFIRKK